MGRYDVIRFGNQGYFIVSADVSDALDKAAQGQADVIRIPDNLNATIGTNLAKVQSQLEAINIPADWITASMTYRTVVRTITQMFLFMNRFAGINGVTVPLLTDLLPLDTPFSSLSKLNQDRLYKTGASFSLDTSTWSTSTLRQILKNIADQFAKVPVPIGCATI